MRALSREVSPKAKEISIPQVEDLSGYLSVTHRIKDFWEVRGQYFEPWFRGQEESSWPLLPGIYRTHYRTIDEDDLRFEFKLRSAPYLQTSPVFPETDWDWYFIMQHYGLPTRLIDWTEGSLIALYFALRNATSKSNPVVWALNPFVLNVASGSDEIFVTSDRKLRRYLSEPYGNRPLPKLPLAIQPGYNSTRISAQRGLFTIHGSQRKALEANKFLKRSLLLIRIAPRSVDILREQLLSAGISELTIFPELPSLCRDILEYWRA